MSATPPLPPTDGDAPPGAPTNARLTTKALWWAVVGTSLLHLGLPILFALNGWIVEIKGNCANVPCDTGPLRIADVLVHEGAFVAFGLSVVMSVVLLVRRRHAWYVPIAAGFVMSLAVSVALVIALLETY